jgi:hypothetical protein
MIRFAVTILSNCRSSSVRGQILRRSASDTRRTALPISSTAQVGLKCAPPAVRRSTTSSVMVTPGLRAPMDASSSFRRFLGASSGGRNFARRMAETLGPDTASRMFSPCLETCGFNRNANSFVWQHRLNLESRRFQPFLPLRLLFARDSVRQNNVTPLPATYVTPLPVAAPSHAVNQLLAVMVLRRKRP